MTQRASIVPPREPLPHQSNNPVLGQPFGPVDMDVIPEGIDRHSGVDLVDAVAASTANGFGVPP
jgi:hypothetical protein